MSAMTELVVEKKRVAGLIFEREWRKDIMDKVEDGLSCQVTCLNSEHRGDSCYLSISRSAGER